MGRSAPSCSRSNNQEQQDVVSSSSRRSWPADALQVVEAQLGLLNSSSSNSTSCEQGGVEESRSNKNIVIDLEAQQPALPHGWEQFLDLKTGEVYYIDWSSCKRTCRDPRQLQRLADDKIRAMRQQQVEQQHSSCSSPCHMMTTLAANNEEDDGCSSAPCCDKQVQEEEDVMVAAGCHRCLMYYMLPRLDPACPSCGALLQDVRDS